MPLTTTVCSLHHPTMTPIIVRLSYTMDLPQSLNTKECIFNFDYMIRNFNLIYEMIFAKCISLWCFIMFIISYLLLIILYHISVAVENNNCICSEVQFNKMLSAFLFFFLIHGNSSAQLLYGSFTFFFVLSTK